MEPFFLIALMLISTGLYLAALDRNVRLVVLSLVMFLGVTWLGLANSAERQWEFLVITWYGDIPPEAVSVRFDYQSDCLESHGRLVSEFEANSDPLFGYIMTECEVVEELSDGTDPS